MKASHRSGTPAGAPHAPDDEAAAAASTVRVRAARRADLPQVIALDAAATGLHKSDYWQRVYRRYGVGGQGLRHFLVAVDGTTVLGFVIGEVRDWEFGSPPCGWVFAIDVDPQARLTGSGTALLSALRARFRAVGVTMLRTMISRDNQLLLSFFRSLGMTAGRLIPLQMELGEGSEP
ncbi:MAG: GNAT family N-acetyltransferase [Burkholderiales bacterium]|nr:GNAT family N-acetyltransferase [Burkholderiales bacterium]